MDNYLFLGSITPKVLAKEEKASKEHGRHERRQQIALIFKIVIVAISGQTFQLAFACAFKQQRKAVRKTFSYTHFDTQPRSCIDPPSTISSSNVASKTHAIYSSAIQDFQLYASRDTSESLLYALFLFECQKRVTKMSNLQESSSPKITSGARNVA